MSPRKLTESDKREIVSMYRQLPETTSTLATRYGVSSSTISRLLKNTLLEEEYEALIQQKRTRSQISDFEAEAIDANHPLESASELESDVGEDDLEGATSASRILRLRSYAPSNPEDLSTESKETPQKLIDIIPAPQKISAELVDEPDGPDEAEVSTLEEMFGEDLSDLDEEDEDLEDGAEEDWEDYTDISRPVHLEKLLTERGGNIQVLPLSEASLPKTCYLVVDRAAELIARPLKDFSDLGKIPLAEVQQRTMPIFDNHRVARRFSNRTQRVIKIPDTRVLQKTRAHLQAKGITRLLIDGQVYSL